MMQEEKRMKKFLKNPKFLGRTLILLMKGQKKGVFKMGLKKKENNYFFCYDRKLADYLRYEKGIKYITAARHLASGNIFYLFERTPELQEALDQRSNGL